MTKIEYTYTTANVTIKQYFATAKIMVKREMYMRRKFSKTVAMMCVCGVALTGCGGNGGGSASSTEPASQAEQEQTIEKEQTSTAVAAIAYEFAGKDAEKAGYAEGTVTFTAPEKGNYSLYWSDDNGALEGYYEIAQMELASENASESFSFAYHTAIPADATKIIAVTEGSDALTVEGAVAVYDIPQEKQLGYKSTDAVYTFNSYSDIHIDEEHWGEAPAYWWEYSEKHWADALDYATKNNVDFIVSSGDQVTNANFDTLDKEWKAFHYILSQSDYVNPIYESNGNHELRQDGVVPEEMQAFMIGTGLNSDIQTVADQKPYYSFTEPKTGDLFIVMALETGYRPAKYDEFSNEQLDWVESLIKENYGKGKNIFLIQHALMSGYGPGDDLETPYYGGSIDTTLESAVRFKEILETYKDIVWISGHSHETFELGYNYTNNDGNACNMIHNSSVANPTHVTDGEIDYTFNENMSQGYLVQTFEKAILFNGANLCDQKIYPAYSYIIDGNTSKSGEAEDVVGKTTLEVTAGNVRSIIANTRTVLGVYYEYSSYNQYQQLKKTYYQYKDADIDAMTDEQRSSAYDELSKGIAKLNSTVANVQRILNNEPIVLEEETEEVAEEEQAVTREKPVTVKLHYHRPDGKYTDWSVWMWGTGDGTDNAFTGKDDNGVYLEYKADVDVEQLGFIIRTQEWTKDFDGDQYIDLRNVTTETLDVYVESGVEGYTVK